MQAFLSYQTADKHVAGAIRSKLTELGIESFLAHEDIAISREWQREILQQLGEAELFVAVLSRNYLNSSYCIQESGIAISRQNVTIMPLSIDGTLPPGFLAHIQSHRIDPERIDSTVLLSGIAKHNTPYAIEIMIDRVAGSRSYRGAEANFGIILPYLRNASVEQIVRLLEVSERNGEVFDAGLCASGYLPPLLKSHGHHLKPEVRQSLIDKIAPYAEA